MLILIHYNDDFKNMKIIIMLFNLKKYEDHNNALQFKKIELSFL